MPLQIKETCQRHAVSAVVPVSRHNQNAHTFRKKILPFFYNEILC
jgi:hypothetical protein